MGKSGKWLKKILGTKKGLKSSSNEQTVDDKVNTAVTEEHLEDAAAVADQDPKQDQTATEVANDQNSGTEEDNNNAVETVPSPTDEKLPAVNDDLVQTTPTDTDYVAALKIQTAFRVFLVTKGVMVDDFVQARQALRALRALIRLQAMVRGHAVRKEAAISLRAVLAIVKVQALMRGYYFRMSEQGQDAQRQLWHTQQSHTKIRATFLPGPTNLSCKTDTTFYQKLLTTCPPENYNLFRSLDLKPGWDWLNRWTDAKPWTSVPRVIQPDSTTNDLLSLGAESNGDLVVAAVTAVDGEESVNVNERPVKTAKRIKGSDNGIPSYMAITESAKAKIRNTTPKTNSPPPAMKRRFSLPSANGKFPETQPYARRLSFPVRASYREAQSEDTFHFSRTNQEAINWSAP